MKPLLAPSFTEAWATERELMDRGHSLLVGIDEVGRGCWAGSVWACAVGLIGEPPAFVPVDSKTLSRERRAEFARQIAAAPELVHALGEATVEEVDRLNILQATFLAMRRAWESLQPRLPTTPAWLLVDGRDFPFSPARGQAVVGGDQRYALIAAASILAKERRDAQLRHLDPLYPNYGFAQHKGYGTRQHLLALQKHGPCPLHRRSFAPVKKVVG